MKSFFSPQKRLSAIFILWIGVLLAFWIARETPTGTISGTVRGAKDKAPVPNASVFIPSLDLETVTDSSGRFAFPKVEEGKHEIWARAYGYWTQEQSGVDVREGIATETGFFLKVREPEVHLRTGMKVFLPNEMPVVNISGYMAQKVQFKLYRVSILELAHSGRTLENLRTLPVGPKDLVRSWEHNVNRSPDGSFQAPIQIPVPREGVYVLEGQALGRSGEPGAGGVVENRTWFSVTDLGFAAKSSSGKTLFYVTRLSDGRPRSSADLAIYAGGQRIRSGVTKGDGILSLETPTSESALVVARYGESTALGHIYSSREEKNDKLYIYTDRPVYRPDHTVHFKGIVRQGESLRVPRDASVTVRITDPYETTLYQRELRTNSFGAFFGECRLPEESPVGEYTIAAHYNGQDHYQYFSLQEYRKPEFKVEVLPEKPFFMGGAKVKARIHVGYYFGEPVALARISYVVYESDLYYFPRGDYEEEGDMEGGGYGKVVAEGEGVTDEKGDLELTLDAPRTETNKIWTVEAEATDPSYRKVSGSKAIKVVSGLFAMEVRTDRYIYHPGDTVYLQVKAQDHEKHPVKNQNIHLEVEAIQWDSARHIQTYRRILGQPVRTNEKGEAAFPLSVSQEGAFRFIAFAIDQMGNKISETGYLYVAGDTYRGPEYDSSRLELIPDRRIYHPGDTARLLVRVSGKNPFALLSLEGDRLYDYQVLEFTKSTRIVSIPIRETYRPNVFVTLTSVKGKQFLTKQISLRVAIKSKVLSVKVTSDKTRYKPGERALYTLQVTDAKGNPAVSEVSLGVVDESIYAVREETIQPIDKFFYARKYNRVDTAFSVVETYSGGAAQKEGKAEVRKYFPDTAFWKASLVTDSSGRATVSFQLPDSLTSWRATARAVTMSTEVGSSTQNILTFKPLLVRLEPPRFFSTRDELLLIGVIHNYTEKKQKVKARIVVSGLDLLEPAEKEISVPSSGLQRLTWKVKASHVGEGRVTLFAEGEGVQDAMELTMPIQPHGQIREDLRAGEIKDLGSFEFSLPPGANKESLKWRIRVSPSLGNVLLEGLEYLAGYPYGCVEQTMSKLLPDLTVARTLRDLGMKNEKLEGELPKMVRQGLVRLYGYQHGDGGWGWWHQDETSPHQTAYVIYGLMQAQSAGFPVKASVLESGTSSLKEQIQKLLGKKGKKEWDTLAFTVYAYPGTSPFRNQLLNTLYGSRKALSPYGTALLALTAASLGDAEKRDSLCQDLRAMAVTTETQAYWNASAAEAYTWMDNSIETTSYVLRALMVQDSKDPLIPKGVRWLVTSRKGNRWLSTKDTAAALQAVSEYMRASGELKPNYEAEVHVNHKQVKSLRVSRPDLPLSEATITIAPSLIEPGRNVVSFAKKGEGVLYYDSSLVYVTDEEDIQASDEGIALTREYLRATPYKDKKGEIRFRTFPIKGDVRAGEKILVRLTLAAKRNYRYIVFEDPLPSGCEVVTRGEDYYYENPYWWAREEVHDDKVAFFVDSLRAGEKQEFTYEMSAGVPGHYHVMPTRGYGMYRPDVRGNGKETSLTIKRP